MCDCEGEGHSHAPARVVASGCPVEADPGESILRDCEATTGVRPVGCPWAALRDPFVAEVIRAHAWREDGQLDVRYPLGVPSRVASGLEIYRVALNAVRVHDQREDRKRRDEERRAAEAKRSRQRHPR